MSANRRFVLGIIAGLVAGGTIGGICYAYWPAVRENPCHLQVYSVKPPVIITRC